jgi:hypothetical protein
MCAAVIWPVHAASFDCSKARTPQEKLICFDYRLSDLDNQLAWSYMEALKQSKSPVALKQSQKNWVAACGKCTNVNCIIHAYVKRIEELIPETKLSEVYFPKEKIPWDFFSKPGYTVTSAVQLKENKLTFITYLKGTILHGDDLIIPAGEYSPVTMSSGQPPKNRLQELSLSLVNNKFELIHITEDSAFIELGDVLLARMASGYGECRGKLGMSGIYVARAVPWTRNNILVQIRPHGWTVWKSPGEDDSCQEAQLKIDPTMMGAAVFNQSLYLYEYHGNSDFVIRLDRNLQTASSLLGKKIFFGWGSDLDALTGKVCEKFALSPTTDEYRYYTTKHRVCIDEQLQKLIGEVARFYN